MKERLRELRNKRRTLRPVYERKEKNSFLSKKGWGERKTKRTKKQTEMYINKTQT